MSNYFSRLKRFFWDVLRISCSLWTPVHLSSCSKYNWYVRRRTRPTSRRRMLTSSSNSNWTVLVYLEAFDWTLSWWPPFRKVFCCCWITLFASGSICWSSRALRARFCCESPYLAYATLTNAFKKCSKSMLVLFLFTEQKIRSSRFFISFSENMGAPSVAYNSWPCGDL